MERLILHGGRYALRSVGRALGGCTPTSHLTIYGSGARRRNCAAIARSRGANSVIDVAMAMQACSCYTPDPGEGAVIRTDDDKRMHACLSVLTKVSSVRCNKAKMYQKL